MVVKRGIFEYLQIIKAKMCLSFQRRQIFSFLYIFQLIGYNFSKKSATSQTHFGFTQLGLNMHCFKATTILQFPFLRIICSQNWKVLQNPGLLILAKIAFFGKNAYLSTPKFMQCGNFIHKFSKFHKFRFYVKSILGIHEVQNLPF